MAQAAPTPATHDAPPQNLEASTSTRSVLLDADQDARNIAVGLEATGKLPPGFVARHYLLTQLEQLELRRLKACALAATDVDVFVALCKGEAVPLTRIQPRLANAYVRRTA